jgi:hypothetical protein
VFLIGLVVNVNVTAESLLKLFRPRPQAILDFCFLVVVVDLVF